MTDDCCLPERTSGRRRDWRFRREFYTVPAVNIGERHRTAAAR